MELEHFIPNITFKIIEDNPKLPWNWSTLSSNPNITFDIIVENPDKPWALCIFSENPNITFKIIEDNPHLPWDWSMLSENPFTKERELFMEQKMREHLAAFKIQTYWRRANENPQYELCKRRLMRECEELGIE